MYNFFTYSLTRKFFCFVFICQLEKSSKGYYDNINILIHEVKQKLRNSITKPEFLFFSCTLHKDFFKKIMVYTHTN